VVDGRVDFLRHFFVPRDWFSGARDIISSVSRSDVLFAKNDKVAIVKNGLDHWEQIWMRPETE
jgi:hypothetical protein